MKYKITAPGRVNLIGEHTDYNGGFVLPMAIDLSLTMFGSKKEGRLIHVTADDCGENEVFSLDRIERKGVNPSWVDYIKGVCRVLEQNNYRLTGAELAFSGSIPIGAGLSSSAALELATASILSGLSGYNISLVKLAMICQEAENDFVGVQCGIMDQFSVALSRKGHALFLDCQTLDYEYVPLELGEHVIMIIDSRVKRALANSEYNKRREECEEVVRRLSDLEERSIMSLRDVTLEIINKVRPYLPDLLYRRGRYVVEENVRVKESIVAIKKGDLTSFGCLMNRSHAGLRDLYEVSSPELDLITETALSVKGVVGTRMTGAGFGGCAVVLLAKSQIEDVTQQVSRKFAEFGWTEPGYYLTSAAAGIEVEKAAD